MLLGGVELTPLVLGLHKKLKADVKLFDARTKLLKAIAKYVLWKQ